PVAGLVPATHVFAVRLWSMKTWCPAQARARGFGIGLTRMKIADIEVFQVSWAPDDRPQQRSAFVRVHTDDRLSGIGEASPMQGGLASLGIIARDIAPGLIGKDPLDHTVLLDAALHTFVKLGPEGALSGALAALDIALWDLKANSSASRSINCSAVPGAPACRSTP